MSNQSINIINISILKQELIFFKEDQIYRYPVSTSKYGEGNLINSNKTPLGQHMIAEKIGYNLPLGAVLKNRKWTGKICSETDNFQDLITSRIIWLKGMEQNYNLGGRVDTYQRYIYIHGTSCENQLGQKSSQGCIRMKNSDILELFELVQLGMPVVIS